MRVRCPGETAFYRVLGDLPEDQVETVLLRWQEKLPGPPPDTLIAIDGQTLRHARGQELVSAIGTASGRWLGTVRVAEGSNEIPAAQTLIDRLELDGKLVVLDALHTQDRTAQQLHFDRGADYVMTVKANQKSLYQTLETKLQTQFFFPRRRREVRALQTVAVTPEEVGFAGATQIGQLRTRVRGGGRKEKETRYPHHQREPRAARRVGAARRETRLLGD